MLTIQTYPEWLDLVTAPETTGPSPEAAADAFLAAALREGALLPELPTEAAALVPRRALHHGVTALVVARSEALDMLPEGARSAMRNQALGEAMWDLRHRQVLVPLIEQVTKAGIPAVLLKGTALAYSLYPSPALRQRGDTDVLVPMGVAEKARWILMDAGFLRNLDSTIGEGIETNRQECWIKSAEDGTEHVVDLHVGVMHSWSLAELIDVQTVMARSAALPGLSPRARRIGDADALYHACLHRGVHIKSPYHVDGEVILGGDRLIWLYDLHLLAPHLLRQDWDDLLDRVQRDRTADLCFDALSAARRLLGTQLPKGLLAALEARVVTDGPSFFLARASDERRFLSNLSAVPGLGGKLAYLRTVFFPSSLYMRQKYPGMAGYPVPLLHLRRITDRMRRRSS